MKLRFFTKKARILFSLFLFFCVVVVSAQTQKTITGTVLSSEDNSPLPGASVVVKGTSLGVSTDLDGKFSINVATNTKTLLVSFVGYQSQEVAVSDGPLTIVLQAGATLDEYVVTALGITRSEKALGYAVQTVSGESLQKVSGVDVATSLTGKVAGLLVRNSTDFAAVPVLTIRGENPLLVIDGIAYANKSLKDLASEDIESMSILKGATASALYGFRGAGGAILITTKSGKDKEAGISIDYTSNTMFSAGFLAIPEKQSLYGRGGNNTYDKNSTSSWGTVMEGQILNQWDPFLKEYRDYPYLPVGKDNFANFLEQGYITNNNFNIAYKGSVASLRSSLNWTENKGIYPNSVLDKYSYTLGGDINLGKFNLTSNVAYSKIKSPNQGSNGYTSYDPMYSLLIWSPTDYNILDYKDNYWITPNETQNWTYASSINNPYFDKYEKINETSRDIFNADLAMSYQLTDWLKASIRSGLDFYTDRGELRISWGSYLSSGNTPVPGNLYTWNGTKTGAYNIGQTQGHSINTDVLFTGDKSFVNDKFKVEYLAGGTIFYKQDDNIAASTVGGLSVPAFFSIKASVNPASVSTTTYAQQVNSVYGSASLSWDQTVYLEMTARNDWSSTLPAETQSYFYPSVASSFVVSELLPKSTEAWLDLLKIRSSWTMSKTPPGIYSTTANSLFTINSATWNTLNGASAPSAMYGSDILPESANTFELGLQTIVFKNRLSVDIAYYSKLMYDFIKAAPLTSASGYTGTYTNIDEEITRNGWEVALTGSPIKTADWQWNIGLNWSTFKRVYTKLDPTYSSVKPWIAVGERVDAYIGRQFLRDPATGEFIYSNGRIQKSAYDSKFGNSDPDWIWGLNSTLKYKDFSLFVSMDGVVGGLMTTMTESYMWAAGVHPNSLTPERALDVATPGSQNYIGQGVKIVSGTVTYDPVGNILTDTRVFAPNDVASTYRQAILDLHAGSAWGGTGTTFDAYAKTFFKLREISLTYTVPNKILQGWAIKGASVSLVGQNVFMKAKDFKYSDPDGGWEDFSDPSIRYIGGNIKLTF